MSLLDKIDTAIQEKVNLNASELPPIKVLLVGTWTAGLKIAKKLRKDSAPPIKIKSDGSVFFNYSLWTQFQLLEFAATDTSDFFQKRKY
ncbi:MAG: DUF1688 family protein [Microcoleaceae cyanobacterium]